MQTTRLEERNATGEFRAAFAEARDASAAARPALGVVTAERMPSIVWYEARIEKRKGSRSANVARWNKLGRKGWQLIAVDRKHAFFRRDNHLP